MAKKKIYISPSNQVANAYATGGTNEKEQCHKIAKACVDYLKKAGFDVKCTYNDDMYARVKESNDFKADMHIAVHTNATAKHNVTGGTQVLLYSLDGERMKAGTAVFNRVSSLTPGKSAEKLIAKPSFYECKNTTGIAVYVEAEFHDTKEGSDFIIKNTTAIGEAIAKGVCDYYGVSVSSQSNKPTTTSSKKAYNGTFPKLPSKGYFEKGDGGVQVRLLQKFLNWYGNYGLAVDGDFGRKTLAAVKDFQKKNGLVVDGLFGAKSLARAKIVKK